MNFQKAGRVVALLGLAVMTGGMMFFGTVMTPSVFVNLPREVAAPYLRAAFPLYYAYVVITATFAACGFLLRRDWRAAGVLFAIVAVVYWSLFWQLPHLDALSAAGDMAGFNRGHTLSVWLYGAEGLAALVLFLRLAMI